MVYHDRALHMTILYHAIEIKWPANTIKTHEGKVECRLTSIIKNWIIDFIQEFSMA